MPTEQGMWYEERYCMVSSGIWRIYDIVLEGIGESYER